MEKNIDAKVTTKEPVEVTCKQCGAVNSIISGSVSECKNCLSQISEDME